MMMGLGVGGVAVGMFHLITHAFFKALLFLGAGSVIHGCARGAGHSQHGRAAEVYADHLRDLCGGHAGAVRCSACFSGFWSKDEILHSAHLWSVSQVPFYLGAAGALLTAFYMTRQVYYVFFGRRREPATGDTLSLRTRTARLCA